MRLDGWYLVGGAAQVAFASRFLVQWIASEVQRKTVFPAYFWYASLLGSAGLLAYAVHIRDPIFIVGQAFGVLVYIRNLRLRKREASA